MTREQQTAIEYTWRIQPIVVAQCTGELGTVEKQYKIGLCAVRVYHDRMEASQDGRTVPLNHLPKGIQRSAYALRSAIAKSQEMAARAMTTRLRAN